MGCDHDLEHGPVLEQELAEDGLVLRHAAFLQQEAETDSGEQPEDEIAGAFELMPSQRAPFMQ
jgi:hypothetical protein